jgi:hypothetical protein
LNINRTYNIIWNNECLFFEICQQRTTKWATVSQVNLHHHHQHRQHDSSKKALRFFCACLFKIITKHTPTHMAARVYVCFCCLLSCLIHNVMMSRCLVFHVYFFFINKSVELCFMKIKLYIRQIRDVKGRIYECILIHWYAWTDLAKMKKKLIYVLGFEIMSSKP